MYSSDLQDLLKVLAAVFFICFFEFLRRKLLKTRTERGRRAATKSKPECVRSSENKPDVEDERLEITLKYVAARKASGVEDFENTDDCPTGNEYNDESMKNGQFATPLTTEDTDTDHLFTGDDEGGEGEVTGVIVAERGCSNPNKATTFDTEHQRTSALHSSNDSSRPAITPQDGNENQAEATEFPSSLEEGVNVTRRFDDTAGHLEEEQSGEVRWMENASRSGSNAFQLRGSPPNYEDIATEFCGAGPIFHSREKLGPNGGTIAVAGCGVVVPRYAMTEEHEISVMCCYPEFPFKNVEWMAITPDVFMGPPGLFFRPKLGLSVPTYFEPVRPTDLFTVKIQKRAEGGQWQDLRIAQYSFGRKILVDVDHAAGFRALVGRHLEDKLVKKLSFIGFIKRFTLRNSPDEHFLVLRVCNDLPHNIKFVEAEMQTGDYEIVMHQQSIAMRKDQHVEIELLSECRNVQMDFSACRLRIKNEDLWMNDTLHLRTFKIRKNQGESQGLVNLICNVKVSYGDGSHSQTCSSAVRFHWEEAEQRL